MFRASSWPKALTLLAIAAASLAAAFFQPGQEAEGETGARQGVNPALSSGTTEVRAVDPATIAVAQLPPQGQDVLRLIYQGGPFRYDKDGTVFFNRERLLPGHPRGYYREYTVPTPGLSHRGARRIVCGGAQPSLPETCYYTSDHYASFRRILQ